MSEKPVYIITFNSANYSMYVYKLLKDKKTLIREIHKKYVNPEIRRYVYEKLEF